VMRRELLDRLGGMDERYVIGDFEDADICLRVRDEGLRCVVDNRAVLYHLERQSQNEANDAWRMNLTLFNAWQHRRRWLTGVVDAT
jgi:GT2 family glycosyltransferase